MEKENFDGFLVENCQNSDSTAAEAHSSFYFALIQIEISILLLFETKASSNCLARIAGKPTSFRVFHAKLIDLKLCRLKNDWPQLQCFPEK
jgi:hypothetical protein